jgi:hypothetical protein
LAERPGREKHQERQWPADGGETVVFFLWRNIILGIGVMLDCPFPILHS